MRADTGWGTAGNTESAADVDRAAGSVVPGADVAGRTDRMQAPPEAVDAPAPDAADRPVRFAREKQKRASEARKKRLISPLTLNILTVNLLALAIPVGGLLYLGAYRDSLIDAEFEALKTQAEVFAGAIGEGAIATTLSGDQMLDIPPAQQIVRRLSAPTQVRARLFLPDGELAADSRLLIGGGGIVHVQVLPPPSERNPVVDPIIDFLDWLPRRRDLPAYREAPQQTAGDYEETLAALRGESQNMLRLGGRDGQYLLSVAVPVQRYRQVLGALMLSKDGAHIDRAVRTLRLDVLKLFGAAMVVTVLLSLYLAGTIARPVRRLAAAAERVRRDIGRKHHPIPDFTTRGDEIGELSGAFRAMTAELQLQLDAIERFAADVSHELKNPLTSLRSAVETASRVKDAAKQRQLLSIVEDDVRRLDRLITDIADASRLDAELSRAMSQPVDVGSMLLTLADMHRATAGASDTPELVVALQSGSDLCVSGMEDRLVQVFHNLIGNAMSFSPPGGTITLSARRDSDMVEIEVEDRGPGIPEAKLEAIFDRFYSERPSGEKFGTHSGLGLSISKQIVEAHGGSIGAVNVLNGDRVVGARFTVRLPAAEPPA